MNSEEDYTMYILVNNDLQMGKGKLGAQIGHAVEMITTAVHKMNNREYIEIYKKYLQSGSKKIVLKASKEDLEMYINDRDSVYVIDAGKTQIPSGSLTAVAFLPSNKNKERFKHFKLL
jgi:PTH2 family peptidyl-tRNA hydrolase